MKRAVIVALNIALVAGCATAPVANPWSTPEVEFLRSKCLEAGMVWLETQEQYACRAPGKGEGA